MTQRSPVPFTQLHCTNRQNLRELIPLAKPFTLLIEPSSLCNFKCTQCFHSLKERNYFSRNRLNMPLERFRRVLSQAQSWPGERLKVLKLSLYGEPLVNPDFPEMLRLARAANIAERIETTTNASLLTPDIAAAMVQQRLDYLRVSIYAIEQEKHRAVTHSPVRVETIRDNLRQLQEIKRQAGSQQPFVSVKMMDAYDAENDAFLVMFGDVADEAFIDKPHGWIAIDGADFLGNYYQDKLPAVLDDLKRTQQDRVACPMGFTTMAVRSNGDVSPCCVDFIGGTNLGNMEERDIQSLWTSAEWYAFLKMQLEGRGAENTACSRCDFFRSVHYTKDNIDGIPVSQLHKLFARSVEVRN